jgi:hypothetical protein
LFFHLHLHHPVPNYFRHVVPFRSKHAWTLADSDAENCIHGVQYHARRRMSHTRRMLSMSPSQFAIVEYRGAQDRIRLGFATYPRISGET